MYFWDWIILSGAWKILFCRLKNLFWTSRTFARYSGIFSWAFKIVFKLKEFFSSLRNFSLIARICCWALRYVSFKFHWLIFKIYEFFWIFQYFSTGFFPSFNLVYDLQKIFFQLQKFFKLQKFAELKNFFF